MHRAAAAELLHVLEPNKKADAVKLIEDFANDSASMYELMAINFVHDKIYFISYNYKTLSLLCTC